jgi:hypothetical protein
MRLTAWLVLRCSLLPCRARLLADEVRSATVSYLSVVKGAEGGVTKLSVPRFHLHPALQRAYKAAEAAWRQVRLGMCWCNGWMTCRCKRCVVAPSISRANCVSGRQW